jgi:ribose 5-phosphate isomerase B
MRIAIAADELVGVAAALRGELERRGHQVSAHGALARGVRTGGPPHCRGAGPPGEECDDRAGPPQREDWAWCSEAAAREILAGRAQQAVVCCWTGTGASIAANKVAGIRAALCADAATAAGARRWNDANVLALSLRTTSEAELREILDAWFATAASDEIGDRENVAYLREIELRGPD